MKLKPFAEHEFMYASAFPAALAGAWVEGGALSGDGEVHHLEGLEVPYLKYCNGLRIPL